MADLDLTGESGGEETRTRRRRRSSSSEESKPSGTATEGEVRSQLNHAFDGLAKNRDSRNDPELAEALREEAQAMTEGFVTLTNNVTFLRTPFVIVLNLLIVLLAFGRVGGILAERWARRREERAAERAAAQGQPMYDGNGEAVAEVPYEQT